jgi:hypothetical protein
LLFSFLDATPRAGYSVSYFSLAAITFDQAPHPDSSNRFFGRLPEMLSGGWFRANESSSRPKSGARITSPK